MVYRNNLVVVLKSKGKVLREIDNCVYIPFGNEYTILLKNLFTRKTLVNVEIDGKSAIDNLIIHPNSEIELERFFEGSYSKGHKFKFVEKTDDIKEFRGDKVDDGIIRITYQFEKFENIDVWTTNVYYDGDYVNPWNKKKYRGFYGNDIKTFTNDATPNFHNITSNVLYNAVCEDGITVNGDYSDQMFTEGSIGQLESETHCIIIQLKGKTDKNKINKPVTTKTKFYCDVCGKSNKSKNKFCSNCGNCLI